MKPGSSNREGGEIHIFILCVFLKKIVMKFIKTTNPQPTQKNNNRKSKQGWRDGNEAFFLGIANQSDKENQSGRGANIEN